MDPFAGNNRDPQSLHKYLYAHCNPVNNIDPSGTMVKIIELNVTVAIMAFVFILLATTVLNPAWRQASQSVADAIVASIAALIEAGAISLEDAFRRISQELRNLRDRFKLDRMNMIFLHYSFLAYAGSLLLRGLLPGRWATLDPYPTGWMAKWFLALPGPPRNAVYIVWPRKGFGPTYGGIVPPMWGMPGGGTQLFFAFGSGGKGTIIGPIPLPKGRRPGP